MSGKPSINNPRYKDLDVKEALRQVERDTLLWEQAEALKEANRLKNEELHGKPTFHDPLQDYKANIDDIIEKDEYEEIHGKEDEYEYIPDEEDLLCDQIYEIENKYAEMKMQKDNLEKLANSGRSDIAPSLSVLVGIIVAVFTGPFHSEFLIYAILSVVGVYLVVNVIHSFLKNLAKNKIKWIDSELKNYRQKRKEFKKELDDLDNRATKRNKTKSKKNTSSKTVNNDINDDAYDSDPLLEEVIYYVVDKQEVSETDLQKKFNIPINRVKKIILQMKVRGIIMDWGDLKPMEVLWTKEKLQEIMNLK